MIRYRAAPADAVRIVPLDEFTLAYHRPAGATHLLAAPAPEILAALAPGQASADELLARLGAQFDLDGDADDGIVAHLQELVAAGLVSAA